ncbi:Os05g0537901 [Oryza sativa Japonica Group]|uniref:Os05g0537901 protein n=1 Tax=Oryza sativa subsp. japonica TaxID=39947 RepID=A0A0P0WQ82_ORYSJ|nr:Os05g0537901 [Oryza sativa Japonica Group]
MGGDIVTGHSSEDAASELELLPSTESVNTSSLGASLTFCLPQSSKASFTQLDASVAAARRSHCTRRRAAKGKAEQVSKRRTAVAWKEEPMNYGQGNRLDLWIQYI